MAFRLPSREGLLAEEPGAGQSKPALSHDAMLYDRHACSWIALDQRELRVTNMYGHPPDRLHAPDGLSRRQLLSSFAAVAGGTVLAIAGCGRPAYALQAAAVPHTVAPDASPRFRAVAERLLAAMAEHQVPGA